MKSAKPVQVGNHGNECTVGTFLHLTGHRARHWVLPPSSFIPLQGLQYTLNPSLDEPRGRQTIECAVYVPPAPGEGGQGKLWLGLVRHLRTYTHTHTRMHARTHTHCINSSVICSRVSGWSFAVSQWGVVTGCCVTVRGLSLVAVSQ